LVKIATEQTGFNAHNRGINSESWEKHDSGKPPGNLPEYQYHKNKREINNEQLNTVITVITVIVVDWTNTHY
ncbi:18517_t:CDS:2, partial [Gigaspora rosea]